jgi:hypothetical protein
MVFSCFKSTAAKKRVATSAVKAMGLPFTVTRNVSTSALPVPLPFITNKEQHLSGTFSNLKVTVAAPSGEQGDFLSQTKNRAILFATWQRESVWSNRGNHAITPRRLPRRPPREPFLTPKT